MSAGHSVGNGGAPRRRAEDLERAAAIEAGWRTFCEAVRTKPTREAFDLGFEECLRELAASALRRHGHAAMRPTVSGAQR